MQKHYFALKDWTAVHWRINRRFFMMVGLFVAIGIIIGLITVFNPLLTHIRINRTLIDTNLFNSTGLNQGFGRMIFSRLLDVGWIALVLFALNLNRWTALLTFGIFTLRTSMIIINTYWAVMRFGMMSGLVLAIVYLIVLVTVLILIACMAAYLYRTMAGVRRNGLRNGMCWSNFWQVMIIFGIVTIVIAIVEFILFVVILSNFIYLHPII